MHIWAPGKNLRGVWLFCSMQFLCGGKEGVVWREIFVVKIKMQELLENNKVHPSRLPTRSLASFCRSMNTSN